MEKIDLFVPGRLCLFGEHSDWTGEYRKTDKTVLPGKCIVTGTDQGIYGTASAATCVLVARAFSRIHELHLSGRINHFTSLLLICRQRKILENNSGVLCYNLNL